MYLAHHELESVFVILIIIILIIIIIVIIAVMDAAEACSPSRLDMHAYEPNVFHCTKFSLWIVECERLKQQNSLASAGCSSVEPKKSAGSTSCSNRSADTPYTSSNDS